MRLVEAKVQNYKSIDDSGAVTIDPKVTVLVGQNEAGKTGFLQALEKARPMRKGPKFDVTEDYPRKSVNEYRKRHATKPDIAVVLTYELTPAEVEKLNKAMGAEVLGSNRFTLSYGYGPNTTIGLPADEGAFIKAAIKKAKLPAAVAKAAAAATTVRALIGVLEAADLNEEGTTFLQSLKTRFASGLKLSTWDNVVSHEIYDNHLGAPPQFLYFGDYQLLPGKVNLPALQQRVQNPTQLTEEDETVLRLLEMAGVSLDEVVKQVGYEEAKSRLEGLSITITDQVFEFWTQNKELDVQFDIRADPSDSDPRFQNGPNLYVRIWNRRHRVSVPFSQRSKGFIWFFSFLVWFDSVKESAAKAPVILLLDEPGLSLHALAQEDLLRYIDSVSERHQVVYTTHSPFMVHGDRLHQVRLVEDREKQGTVVTDNVMGSDPKTVFPLQAALGYTVAQNLFVSRRNLLVEGPADLIYLQHVSAQLEAAGRTYLRDDVTIVPVGGLEKVSTFVSLLGANGLKLVVVHDFAGKADQQLESLVREKIIKGSHVLNFGMFRNGTGAPTSPVPGTDVEDMLTIGTYLDLFNGAYATALAGTPVTEAMLPNGDRIVDRLNRYLKTGGTKVRASDGFNHYLPATFLASNPRPLDAATLDRFEALFTKVNALLS